MQSKSDYLRCLLLMLVLMANCISAHLTDGGHMPTSPPSHQTGQPYFEDGSDQEDVESYFLTSPPNNQARQPHLQDGSEQAKDTKGNSTISFLNPNTGGTEEQVSKPPNLNEHPGIFSILGDSEGTGLQNYLVDFSGTMIITNNYMIWELSPEQSVQWLKSKFLVRFKDILSSLEKSHKMEGTEHSCLELIDHSNFDFNYIQYSNNKLLWYPVIRCKHSCTDRDHNITRGLKHSCSISLDKIQRDLPENYHSDSYPFIFNKNLKVSLMPSIPWACPLRNDTDINSLALTDLWLLNNTLPIICGELMCHPKRLLPNIIAFATKESDDISICKADAIEFPSSSSSLARQNAFYFSSESSQKISVFIMGENGTLNRANTTAYILLKLAKNPQIKGCCNHVLDYELKSPITPLVNQSYFFCYGQLESCPQKNDWVWIIDDVTEQGSLVVMNGNISRENVSSNIILQSLISSNASITPSEYEQIAKLKQERLHSSQYFDIPLIQIDPLDVDKIHEVAAKLDINYDRNEHYMTFTNQLSMQSSLNMIISYNCSVGHLKDDKGLLLFLSNSSNLDLEYICDNNTSVIITSLQKKNIPYFFSEDFRRKYPNLGIRESDDGSLDQIHDGSDYETRFYHFLVYPLHLKKESAMKLLFSERKTTLSKKNEINMNMFKKKFDHWNAQQPPIDFAITTLKISESSPSNMEVRKQKETHESFQQTMRMFMIASLTNNSECLEDLVHSRFTIEAPDEPDPGHVQYVIGPISTDVTSAKCLSILPVNLYKNLQASNKSQMIRVNKFWPTCLSNRIISWKGKTTRVADWDYLTYVCKMKETALFSISCTITLTTIVGNVLVLIIMYFSGLLKKKIYKILTSLSVADLLLGVTAAALAVYDTYCLRTGLLTLYDLDEEGSFANFDKLTYQQVQGFQQLRYERYGLHMISSIMMNVSVFASLLTLALLSTDRLLMLRKFSHKDQQDKYSIVLEDHQVNCAIYATWVLSIVCSILVNWRENGWVFVGYFDPITKLTINVGTGTSSMSSVVMYIQMIIAFGAGICVIVATIASAIVYRLDERKKQEILDIHDALRGDRVQVVIHTFIMMVILFMISSVPVGFDLGLNFGNTNPVLHFLVWWIFMAGSSCNWILYCFRGQYFRDKAMEVVFKCLNSV